MLRLFQLLLRDFLVGLQQESTRRLANPFPAWRTELFYDDEDDMSDEVYNTDIIEYGIVLPNGNVLWSQYHNWPLNSPQQRQTMVEVLRKTAGECGFSDEEFLSHYTWVTRRVQTTVTSLGTYPITDPVVTGASSPVFGEDGYDDNDSGPGFCPGDGDGGDLRQGSLGSSA